MSADRAEQPETEAACPCPHAVDEHSVYGCADGCGCEWMPHMPALAPQARCMDCGGEGGGGSMDPDVWIECTTCKGSGKTDPQPECNGICLFGHDLGVPHDGVAYAHPDCPEHGTGKTDE